MKCSNSVPAHLLPKGSVLSWEIEIDDAAPVDDLEWLIGHCMDYAGVLLVSEVLATLRDHSSVSSSSDKAMNRIERRERTIDGVSTSMRFTVDGFPGIPPAVASCIIDGFFESVFSHMDIHVGDVDHTLVMEISSLDALLGDLPLLEKFLTKFLGDQKG